MRGLHNNKNVGNRKRYSSLTHKYTTLSLSSKAKYSLIAKSLEYSEFGNPISVLQLKERELKKEREGDVLVKMIAAPINPADINMIQGVYGIKPSSFPAVGGNEGVGIVQEAGASSLSVGDYVIPSSPSFGTWRTYAVCEESKLTKIPNYISPQTAAVLAVNPSTAYRLLHDSSLKPGDTILQNGANSMVGQAVIQIAHSMNLKTINVVRSREEGELKKLKDKLFGFGANEVFTEEEFATHQKRDYLTRLYPHIPVAFNCTGGKSATELARLLSEGGTMVTYGGMSKQPVTIPTSLMIFKNIQVKGFWLSKWLEDHPTERVIMLNELAYLVKDQKLTFTLEEFSISDYLSALQRYDLPKKDSKVLFYMP